MSALASGSTGNATYVESDKGSILVDAGLTGKKMEELFGQIDKQIKDLNKAEITNNYVNSARKNAIEMYYSLQNYYETRVETIDISDELSKIDHKTLPKESEDLEKYDAVFDKQYNNVKEDYN